MKKFKIQPHRFKVDLFINENNKPEAFIGHTCGTGWIVEGETKEEIAEKIKQFILTQCRFDDYE